MFDTILAVVPMIENPMDGVVPDFSIFGADFNALWKKLLAAAWALGILASIFFIIRGFVALNDGKQSSHPSQMREGRSELTKGAISLGGLAALGVIVGAILTVMG